MPGSRSFTEKRADKGSGTFPEFHRLIMMGTADGKQKEMPEFLLFCNDGILFRQFNDAFRIFFRLAAGKPAGTVKRQNRIRTDPGKREDRKSTRLNSSHSGESRMPSSA